MKITIVGVHLVQCSEERRDAEIEVLYGSDLPPYLLEEAQRCVEEQFAGLRLIEIEVSPPDSTVKWSAFTQRNPGLPRENWQAAYDETLLDPVRGRWAFFLHCVQPDQPLVTQVGDLQLPDVSPMPDRLATKQYFWP